MRLIPTALLCSCLGPSGFARQYADADCAWLADCTPEAAQLLTGSESTCEDFVEASVTTTGACLEQHCAFDPDAARACLDGLEQAGCADDPFAASSDVWASCTDGAESCR